MTSPQVTITHIILYRHHSLPQKGCWRSWWCQPGGHRLTSRARTQKFWGSGRKSWCRSPGKSRFPAACIPWCGKDIGQLVQMSFVLISQRTNKMIPDDPDARWLSFNRTVTNGLLFHHLIFIITHTFTAAALLKHPVWVYVLKSNIPVSIWSDLFNSCLPACQEHLWIGHIEEVILHINRWRWILPPFKHLALLRQSNFLLTKEENTNSGWETKRATAFCVEILEFGKLWQKAFGFSNFTLWLHQCFFFPI